MRAEPLRCVSKWHLNCLKGGWTWHTYPCIQPVPRILPKIRYCDGKYLRWINIYSCISTSTSTHSYFPQVCSLLCCCDALGYNNPQCQDLPWGVMSFYCHAPSPHQHWPCHIQLCRTYLLAVKWGLLLPLIMLVVPGAQSALALGAPLPKEWTFCRLNSSSRGLPKQLMLHLFVRLCKLPVTWGADSFTCCED